MMEYWKYLFLTGLVIISSCVYASDLEQYCRDQGGRVELMSTEFHSDSGPVEGFSKTFCTFNISGGFINIGLATFASYKSNIGATWIKTLKPLTKDSPLLNGPYSNPSLNLCQNLGGSSVSFNVMSGGFKNHLGFSDVCVFGDGSMVSGWSLIYMANGREGYGVVKNAVPSKPLLIKPAQVTGDVSEP